MSRHQAIEQALLTINDTVFQELCDRFLALRNKNYTAFMRTGSQTGKQKTTKGTPDSFFLLENGNFIFIETTTNVSDEEKLAKDIKACFNPKKTKISIKKIEEIVLCFNFNIDQKKIDELYQLATSFKKDIKFSCWSLDALAIELHMHHRDLVYEYLGLPLDTGQIVSIETFIKEYNRAAKGIATPLDNEFVHRETEMEDLKNALLASDFIILTGSPGIGKTKLAIETISEFLRNNINYNAYCISYKNHNLLDDLFQYLNKDKNYILFIDDANRIDAFNQITGFYNVSRTGNLKILVTVRDYAFHEIGILCQAYNPKRIDILKFTDLQITDIIKAKPFEILNPDFQREIIRISDGNPRLAIMASLLAKEEQNLYALYDVSDLFEKYFSTFIKDKSQFANDFNISCLGVISFFRTLPIKNKELLSGVLKNFGIDYYSFIDSIDLLDKLELVEIRFEHVKIPEQNLSVYFFYKSFIKDKLLSFKTLLTCYFDNNISRFNDCVIPANNTFGPQNVMEKLKPDVQDYWNDIKVDLDRGYRFLSTFWFYLQSEALEFIYEDINSLPDTLVTTYDGAYENNAFQSNQNRTIEVLGEFLRFETNLKDSLELAFLLIRKNPKLMPEVIHKIREKLLFDEFDGRQRFSRQTILFETLISGLDKKDPIFQAAFFELAKSFLNFKFNHTKAGRNHSIYWYDYPIPLTKPIQLLRTKIWQTLDDHFIEETEKSFNVLLNYSSISPDVIKEIMEFDIPYLINIINNHLKIDSFEHCRYVQDQIKWCLRNEIQHSAFEELKEKFTNSTYQMFLKIDWNRLRDKEMHEFSDFREYERLKELDIRTSFVFNNQKDIKSFYDSFLFLKKTAKNEWNYDNSLEYVIDENSAKSFDIGFYLLELIVKKNNEINLFPRMLFRNLLKTKESSEKVWDLIQSRPFKYRTHWQLSYFDNLDDTLINSEHPKAILNTINEIEESITIHFDRFLRYLKLEPNLFQGILKAIYKKNNDGKIKVQTWMDFFGEYFDYLGDDISLIKLAYIQQYLIHDHFDYKGKGFLKILKKNPPFLTEFTKSLLNIRSIGDHKDMSFIWNIDHIEAQLIEVFDLYIENERFYGILEHSCNAFFRNLNGILKDRADKFLIDYVTNNNGDFKKINVVVDIARHTRKDMFESLFLLYISLNQDVDAFKRIWWIGNGGSYSGDVIIGDICATDWRNILDIVGKSGVGIKLIPIKKYINDRIESELRSGDIERQSRFLDQFWDR
jgi:hypothetical protein